jgi:hypothetical protein
VYGLYHAHGDEERDFFSWVLKPRSTVSQFKPADLVR